jgi:chitodextrinase
MPGAAPACAYCRTAIYALLLAVCLAAGIVGAASGATRSNAPLVGDQTVESNDDSDDPGKAEAFRTTASATGTVSSLNVYLTSGSAAATITAGIYKDAGGHPGALLGQGSASAHPGDWTSVALGSAASVSEGAVYWIAILGPSGGGRIAFRDVKRGGASETSSQTSLTSLPGSWSTGSTYADGPLSAYGVGVTGPAPDTLSPSTPPGVAVTSTSQTSVSLSWSSSTDNVGVAGYGVYQNGAAAGSTSATSYTVAALTCGTTYTLSVDAYDAAGNRSGKASVTATTSACSAKDTVAPSVPTGLVAKTPTDTSIPLSWSASTDNVGVAGYGVYTNGTSAGSASSTGYTVSGLACGTSYSLAVDAYDAAGNRSAKATITASTTACPSPSGGGTLLGDQNVEPTDDGELAGTAEAFKTTAAASGQASTLAVFLTGLSTGTTLKAGIYSDLGGGPGTLLGQGSVGAGIGWVSVPLASPVSVTKGTVYWIALLGPQGSGTITFRDVRHGGSSVASLQSTLASLPSIWSTGKSYADGPLSAYAVGGAIASSPPPADTLPPSAPLGMAVSASTQTSVSLSWSASSDNVGVAGYTTYKNGAAAGSSASTSYTVSGLSCGTSYTFAVDAYDAAGNRSAKTSLTGATAPCSTDTTAPSVPTGVKASSTTQTSVSLAWSVSTDNVGVVGYGVYQGGASLGSTVLPSYTVSGLTCGTSYTFAVDAYDVAGNRSAKASLTASTAACSTSTGFGSANVFVATGGSDSGANCKRYSPGVSYPGGAVCASLNKAYQLASAGDTIELEAGSYGSQNVGQHSSSLSGEIVAQPAAGATVSFSDLSVAGSYLHLKSVSLPGGASIEPSSGGPSAVTHVTFENVSARYAFILSDSFTMKGGSIGPSNACESTSVLEDGMEIWESSGKPTNGVVIDGVTIHDITGGSNGTCQGTSNGTAGRHVDCLQILGGTNFAIRNSHFSNCAGQDIIARPYDGAQLGPFTIENNMLDEPVNPGQTIDVGVSGSSPDPCTGPIVVQNNTLWNGGAINGGCTTTVTVRNNILSTSSCGGFGGFTWDHNVWLASSGTTCGTNAVKCTPVLAAATTGANYHLATTDTCAKGRADQTNHSATDIDGQTRPQGTAVDAGADEIP